MNPIQESPQAIATGNRFASMVLDHIFMTLIAMVFFIPNIVSSIVGSFNISHKQNDLNFMEGPLAYLSLMGFAIYLCKDCVNGRSIAKRILNLQLVDNISGQVASPLQCFVRNLFIIIWPIEVLMALIFPSRRLGDRVAGTKIVMFNHTLEQPKINILKLLFPLLLSYGIMLMLMLPFKSLVESLQTHKIKFIETSYNPNTSKEIEQMLTDSLGEYLTPSVKVFDTIQNSNLKYVSIIYQLKSNLIENDEAIRELRTATETLIESKLPTDTYKGIVKYVYHKPGLMSSTELPIGDMYRPNKANKTFQ